MKPNTARIGPSCLALIMGLIGWAGAVQAQALPAGLRINSLDYFDAPGLSVLVFHNNYPEGHQGGVEIIQHDERIATCGDLRLESTPGQWDPLPNPGNRTVDRGRGEISVPVHYPVPDIGYTIRVSSMGNAVRIVVDLEKPIPPGWTGKVGFNLELYPPAYSGKSFQMDGAFGVFPRQANGPARKDSLGLVEPLPIASGRNVSIASEDPERRVLVSSNLPVMLYDGRLTDSNGWFVLRTLVPEGATKNAVEWTVTPHVIPGWKRNPVIGFSQVGYHPSAEKRAVIELDPDVRAIERALLVRIEPDGGKTLVMSGTPVKWGKFLRYEYAIFDFTKIQTPGLYRLVYGGVTTPPFPVSKDVYAAGVWQPTLETFLPMQMCHVAVKDGFRTWHGACHLDDALQAPVSHEHFDGYRQGAETETPYAPLTHVPFLDRGGWHDAGDDDLAAGAQAAAVRILALTREAFPKSDADQTTVLPESRLVTCHRPDGIPDFNQQIAHGVENLLSGYRAAGHSFLGIISSSIGQYVHCGDPSTATDNRIYDVSLDSNAVSCDRSGKRDDRWVFTNRDASQEYQVASALAAASRVLAQTHSKLADECRTTAARIWTAEQTRPPAEFRMAYVPGNRETQAVFAALELYVTTKDTNYLNFIHGNESLIVKRIDRIGWCLTRVWSDLNPAFRDSILGGLMIYRKNLDKRLAENPYGIQFSGPTWGIGWNLQSYAMEQFYLIRAFPDIFPRQNLYRALNWVLGCHPGSNTSFVSGVGARSMTTAYGFNRADGSYIPGGGVSGTALIRPDFPELKEPFPFLWQQSEYVLSGAASYLFCVLAAEALLNP
jgi:endoglucanase